MAKTENQNTSKPAKILYQPIGLISSIVAGLIAGQLFKQVWKHATPGDQSDPPKPLESEYSTKEVLLAAMAQGMVFALVKAAVSRGGARAFERWTGEWPGD